MQSSDAVVGSELNQSSFPARFSSLVATLNEMAILSRQPDEDAFLSRGSVCGFLSVTLACHLLIPLGTRAVKLYTT